MFPALVILLILGALVFRLGRGLAAFLHGARHRPGARDAVTLSGR